MQTSVRLRKSVYSRIDNYNNAMSKNEIILSGPEYNGPEFLGSVAEYIIPKMKSKSQDSIVQVDTKTGESIKCHDFLKTSLEVSEGLIEFGLQKGDIVVLACPSSIRSHITAMGILFSGGILAAIDQNLKQLEMQHLFKLFQPKFIICLNEKAEEVQKAMKSVLINAKIILLDSAGREDFYTWKDIRTKVDLDSYVPRKVSNAKTETALICCSSGSTGLPKGVALSHFNISFNNIVLESLDVNGWHETVFMTSPLFWISGIIMLIITCTNGQTRYIPKSGQPQDILEGIQKYRPFSVMLSPANLLFVVDHPDFHKYNLESMKIVLTGGAVLGESVAEKVKATWKGIIFYQAYGMTEVIGPITLPTNLENINTVGKLLPEYRAKVVDVSTGESLGPNKIGELRLKSKRIMIGYYNNEKETKSAFDEDGWFRTGDLVYYNEEELLFIVGRIKEIIKYRNHQISPAEIESFIIGLPGVQDAAVVPVPHEQDSYHLKALVVKSPKSDIAAEDIIHSVKENFSDYKQLRKGVQFVDKLPRSEIGKLRRAEVYEMKYA